jgi:hypothetical protein
LNEPAKKWSLVLDKQYSKNGWHVENSEATESHVEGDNLLGVRVDSGTLDVV